jgi:general nucleoside transport system ATP-binding protein
MGDKTTVELLADPGGSIEATAGAQAPAVELTGITKAFPGVVANKDITLALYKGEVHCLLGENGAGKSTLMNILSGMYQPDEGTIKVGGKTVKISTPKVAIDLGIGMVYQHSTMIPVFTVLENLMLGATGEVRLDRKAAEAALGDLAGKLGVDIQPGAVTGKLALGQQQQVEIIKALWSGSNILILDEPTSMLTPQGIADLEKVVMQLKQHGLAIVFITHKLHEAVQIGDRVSVLKQGRVVGRLGPEDLRSKSEDELQAAIVGMMFGEEARALSEVAEVKQLSRLQRAKRDLPSSLVLELNDVGVRAGRGEVDVQGVTLQVRKGEILGIAGVDGNGQRELAEAMAGQRKLNRGEIVLAGRSVGQSSVAERHKMGLRFVTDDRLGEGMVASLPVSLNLLLKRIGERPFWKRGRVQDSLICESAECLVRDFDIRTPTIETHCGALSGGNLQKMVLARELSFDPRIVIYNKPTYGLDVKTTHAIRQRIRELSERDGVSAVLISTDLEELLDLCDRIGVMFRGRLTGVVENHGAGVETRVGALMLGGKGDSD